MSIEVAAALGSAIGDLISFFLGYSVGRRAKVMSMISAQCDELRSMSESVGLAMPQAATLMMEAADTIDCLDAENAKLREENQSIGLAAYELGRKSMAGENAKLRELVRDVNKAAHMLCEAWEGSCSKEADGMSLYAVCPISDTNELCVFGKLHDRMRELGVEVDNAREQP